jgi:uncharacterized lipoprotein YehR (DUF1307 family)
MKPVKTLVTVMVTSVLLAALAGCEKQEGPMEQAGKSLDKATESAGRHLEDAGQSIQDTARGDKK